MIGVHIIVPMPAQGGHCGVGFGTQVVRMTVDDDVLAVGFVPCGIHRITSLTGKSDSAELGDPLMGKAVAHAEGMFVDDEWRTHGCGWQPLNAQCGVLGKDNDQAAPGAPGASASAVHELRFHVETGRPIRSTLNIPGKEHFLETQGSQPEDPMQEKAASVFI